MADFEADPFPEKVLPAPLNHAALLDRYHSHTKHCASCSGALKRIRFGKKVAIAFTVLGLAIAPLLSVLESLSVGAGVVLTLLPLLVSAIAYGLHRLEQKFYVGRAIPPRNLKKRK